MSEIEKPLRVAIIDCGIDLQKLYNGARHGYMAIWVAVADLSFNAIEDCDIVIIPAGSDSTLLATKLEHLQRYLRHGGWLFSFDGVAAYQLQKTTFFCCKYWFSEFAFVRRSKWTCYQGWNKGLVVRR